MNFIELGFVYVLVFLLLVCGSNNKFLDEIWVAYVGNSCISLSFWQNKEYL